MQTLSLCFIVPELLPIIVYITEIQIFDLFCSCDLDLDVMTFIYELDPYSPGDIIIIITR